MFFSEPVSYLHFTHSAMVGLAVMVACLPLPGYVAKLSQDVQVARMKKTDARVQGVSESKTFLFAMFHESPDGLYQL